MSYYDPSTGILQGASNTGFTTGGGSLGGSTGGLTIQGPTSATQSLQPTTAPTRNQTLSGGGTANTALVDSSVDPAAAAAAAQAAADAAHATALRSEITNLVNNVKNIFDARYGQVDANAGEQVGKLNDRYGNESQDIASQATNENNKVGAAYAGRGTFDSSYRGNDVDTVTHGADAQVRDLGTELNDNISKIAAWVSTQKAGFNAQKGGMDAILAHLGEETDPGRLTDLRNTIESKIAELNSGGADNNTSAQNASALATIAPSSARAVQLKTTLSQIVAGNADSSQKATIGARLIQSAGLDPAEEQKLLQAFQGDLATADQPKQDQTPTA
jgi:hypothetical protein